jgi:hypothetical protein
LKEFYSFSESQDTLIVCCSEGSSKAHEKKSSLIFHGYVLKPR